MSLLWKRKVGTATDDGGDACLGGGIFDGSRLFVSANNTTINGTAYQGSIRQLDPADRQRDLATRSSANVPGPPALDRAGVLVAATHDYIPGPPPACIPHQRGDRLRDHHDRQQQHEGVLTTCLRGPVPVAHHPQPYVRLPPVAALLGLDIRCIGTGCAGLAERQWACA